jgi:hypothetical protein
LHQEILLPKCELLNVENPLLVNTRLAILIGLNPAIVLQQVHYWLTKHCNVEHLFDGRIWTYNTYPDWQKGNFPFWSIDQIKRIFMDLEQEKKLILSSQKYNRTKYDRRKWYSIDYEALALLETAEVANISQDADLHDGTGDSAPTNDQDAFLVGAEMHDVDNNAENTHEIIAETTPLASCPSSSAPSLENLGPSIGFGEVIEPSVLMEMVAGTRLQRLTSKCLHGCVHDFGVAKTLEAVDILRRKKRAIVTDDLAGYIYGALLNGVAPPNNFVPFAEQKSVTAAKALENIRKDNEAKKADAAEDDKYKRYRDWWQSLPEERQKTYALEIKSEYSWIDIDVRGRAFLDLAFTKFVASP